MNTAKQKKNRVVAVRSGAAPAFAGALREIEAEAKARGLHFTRSQVAEKVGIAKSAVSGWFGGSQIPRHKSLEGLAEFFAAGNDPLKAQYRIKLETALGITSSPASSVPPLLRALEQSAPIRIGVVKYDAFSGFFKNILEAFAKYSAFKPDIVDIDLPKLSDAIASGEIDIGAAIFATPDRVKRLKFLDTPLKVSVNALTFQVGRKEIQDVRKAGDLMPKIIGEGAAARPAIAPIVNRGEVGETYAKHKLGYQTMRTSDYGDEYFSNKLLADFQAWLSDRSGPVPIVIVDELQCLMVLKNLVGKLANLAPSELEKYGPPELLLGDPLDQGRAIFNPAYHLSICVGRNDQKWLDYVKEAWEIFASSNIEFLAGEYVKLYEALMEPSHYALATLNENAIKFEAYTSSKTGGLAEQVEAIWTGLVRRWLWLDSDMLSRNALSYPWSAIVALAKEKIGTPSGGIAERMTGGSLDDAVLSALTELRKTLDALERTHGGSRQEKRPQLKAAR
jgi:transcriptional regulator with XRE-family HTH domain